MSIWTITERDIHRLRGAGGELFLEFCDALLRAELAFRGLASTSIATNQRSTKPDGGVDTQVDAALDGANWLASRTSWQYKGTDASDGALADTVLVKEIRKPFSAELIGAGYAYRFAICDDVPAQKRAHVNSLLNAEAVKINPQAPAALLVTSGDLAVWASHYPALRIRFFGGELANLLPMSIWGPSITSPTRHYVAVPNQLDIASGLQAHASLSTDASRVDMVIEGDPGVGKTRLTYESLLACGADQLVLYTNDEQVAVETSALLANSGAAAILVADECSLPARIKMVEVLKGHRSRIRLICIDAPIRRSAFDGEQPWLKKMTGADVDAILAKNFQEVSSDHRIAYRDLSKGYIRLAIDLCQNDTLIAERGLSVALRSVEDYLTARLSDEQRQGAMAVSLFQRVGFRDDVADELNAVAELLGFARDGLRRDLKAIRQGPGFVAEGGRYYYVTPAVVAETLFANAWLHWAEGAEREFLNRIAGLPGELFDSFLKRVSVNGTPEVRRAVGEHFRNIMNNLKGVTLGDHETVRRLSVLIEARPEDAHYLRAALEGATDEEVRAISGSYSRGWGSRRTLVWLAVKLARYEDSFHDAEAILWRLAVNEAESVGNNATAQWQQLFRVYLSGSPLPFAERISVFEERLKDARDADLDVAFGAFGGIFSDSLYRSGGTVYMAGRVAPDDWQPRTYGELGAAYRRAIDILRSQLVSPNAERRRHAKVTLTGAFWFLLAKGYFRDATDLVDSASFDANEYLGIVGQARDFVARQRTSANTDDQRYLGSIAAWVETSLSGSADARPLLDYLTAEPLHRLADDEFQKEANRAAVAFLADASRFKEYAQLASAANPYLTAVLGAELGRLDESGELFHVLFEEYQRSSGSSLIGGYISGRAPASPEFVALLNTKIGEIAAIAPAQAAELTYASMRLTDAFARTLAWVSSGDLSPVYLKRFMFGVEGEPLDSRALSRMVRVLLDRAKDGGRSVAIEILAYYAKSDAQHRRLLLADDVAQLVWEVVESSDEQMPSYNWADIVAFLAQDDHQRAMRLAIATTAEGGFTLQKYAERVSIELARDDPTGALAVFAEVLGSDEVTARFLINRYSDFVKSLPLDHVSEWLKTVPIETVRRFARHLEAPTLDADGALLVPPLTAFVLREFEHDDEVFESFYSGIHHLRMYSGDIAQRHAAEASMAKRFLKHPLRRIREWAELEIERGTRSSEMWSQRDAEEESEKL